jgi:hypothetical protein
MAGYDEEGSTVRTEKGQWTKSRERVEKEERKSGGAGERETREKREEIRDKSAERG